jgi:L-aspartate oxidase
VDAAPPERPMLRAPLAELRRRMWRDAGPFRDESGLTRLVGWLDRQQPTNPVLVARAIAWTAQRRQESRGAHIRRDFPHEDPAFAHRLTSPLAVAR